MLDLFLFYLPKGPNYFLGLRVEFVLLAFYLWCIWAYLFKEEFLGDQELHDSLNVLLDRLLEG